jgi:hypothetical protein
MVGYGTIYRFEFDATCKPFATLLTTKCKVLILKKGYNATIYDIPYGQVTPVEIDYPTVDDDIFYPIKGSSLSFKVLGGVINMDSLISEDEKDFYLEYYRDNVLFWSGFVSPELCEEDIFLRYPAIEFKTIDGLGALKTMQLNDSAGRKLFGKRNLLTILLSSFRGVGFGYKTNVLANVWASGFDKLVNPLIQAITYINIYRDKNGIQLPTIDIIKSICYLFNAVIYQNRGQWWFVKIKDLAFALSGTQVYNADGTLASPGTGTVKTFVHGTDFLIVAEPKRKIRRFYKESSLDYQFYKSYKNLDINFSCWTNDDTFTPTRILEADFTDNLIAFNVVRTGLEPNFEFYTKAGSVKTESYYDPRIDNYGIIVYSDAGANTDYVQYSYGALVPEDRFSFSVSSITGNQKVEILIETNSISYYYDIFAGTWNTTRTYNTGGYYPTLFATDLNPPATGILKVRLHSALELEDYGEFFAFYDYITAYNDLLVNITETIKSNQVTTITNIKNTSIVPEMVTVYNGDSKQIPPLQGSNIEDISNLLTGINTKTKEWYERDEEDIYELQELSARNILNQYSDYRNIFTGTLIGKGLEFGSIYTFPIQGALADKKFFPLSMKMNERDNTAEVVLMELTSNEITGTENQVIYDTEGNIIYQTAVSSKKKNRNGVGTDLGEAGESGTLFDRFVAFFMDDFKP